MTDLGPIGQPDDDFGPPAGYHTCPPEATLATAGRAAMGLPLLPASG